MTKTILERVLEATRPAEYAIEKRAAAVASAPAPDFLKIADRCAQAVENSATAEARRKELVEKTAAKMIIERTLGEIEAMDKTASPATAEFTSFVKQALANGHSAEDIAAFLKEAGWVNRARMRLPARLGLGVGTAINDIGAKINEIGGNHQSAILRDAVATMSPTRANALVERLRARYGDETAAKLIEHSGIKANHLPAVRDLKPHMPVAKPMATMSIGGKDLSISKEQAAAIAKPAAFVAGGAAVGHAMFGGGESKGKGGKGRNVVFVGGD